MIDVTKKEGFPSPPIIKFQETNRKKIWSIYDRCKSEGKNFCQPVLQYWKESRRVWRIDLTEKNVTRGKRTLNSLEVSNIKKHISPPYIMETHQWRFNFGTSTETFFWVMINFYLISRSYISMEMKWRT